MGKNEEGRDMSKELIEQLRADAESTDDIGLCADAADRIEELERENKRLSDDHYFQACLTRDLMPYQERAIKAEQKCDALQADNAELVAALEQCNRYAKATLPTGYLALFTGQALAKVRKHEQRKLEGPHQTPTVVGTSRPCATPVV